MGTVERILHDVLHCKEETKSSVLGGITQNVRICGSKRFCDVITGNKTWLSFQGIQNKRAYPVRVGKMPRGQRIFGQKKSVSRVAKRLSPVYLSSNGQATEDSLP